MIRARMARAVVSIAPSAITKSTMCRGESPFATLREVIRAYFQRLFLVPIDAIPDEALDRAEVIAQFNAVAVAPEESAMAVDQPVMIVPAHNESASICELWLRERM